MGGPAARGRQRWRRWSERDASALLAAWSASGLTLGEFARAEGLCYERLRRWRRKLDAPRDHASSSPWSLVPVVVRGADDGGSASSREQALTPQSAPSSTDGATLRVAVGPGVIDVPGTFDPDHLARVVRVLAGRC